MTIYIYIYIYIYTSACVSACGGETGKYSRSVSVVTRDRDIERHGDLHVKHQAHVIFKCLPPSVSLSQSKARSFSPTPSFTHPLTLSTGRFYHSERRQGHLSCRFPEHARGSPAGAGQKL